MCGRFVVATSAEDLVELFDVDLPGHELPAASFNLAPTDRVPIVLDALPRGVDAGGEPVRRLEGARWGLVPAWAKDPGLGATAFNARIESVAEKSHFRQAVHRRRAIVPATGYYEWAQVGGAKVPHFVHLPGGELTVFAGLYEWWRDPAKDAADPSRWLLSTSVITRASPGALADLHDRMPVFLAPELVDEWLDPHGDGSPELLDAVAAGAVEQERRMRFHEVDRAVGDVRNDSSALMAPVG